MHSSQKSSSLRHCSYLSSRYFFLHFLLWSLILQVVVWQIQAIPVFANALQHAQALSAAFFYNLYSSQWLVENNVLMHSISRRFIVVDQACTGLTLLATLIAGTFSLLMPWRNKLLMALLLTFLIQLENSLRIAHLFYLIKQPINNFEFFHLYFWQVLNFMSAIFIFQMVFWKVKKNNYNVIE